MTPRAFFAILLVLVTASPQALSAQVVPSLPQPATQGTSSRPGQPAPGGQIAPLAESLRPNYVLGVGDVVQIQGLGDEEPVERTFRIDPSGEIILPVIGSIKAVGLTADQLQSEINSRLKAFFVNPQAIVTLVQFRSEPVFFIGAFNSPGIYPLQGRRTLVEMLTLVGGLTTGASRRIRLTRRREIGPIELPSAVEDPSGKGMTVEIPLNVLTRDINPPEDLMLMPYDVVVAEKAELVYLSGEVVRPGGYELGEKETVSAIQLLSLAGGPTPSASLKDARILRPISRTARRAEIPIDLKNSLQGRGSEIELMGGDVLYVPRNSNAIAWKSALITAIPIVSTLVVGLVVYKGR